MGKITRSNEKGIALVFTLFLMAALSALAVSLTFLSQTETAGTRNYRTMSQARYAGEAGVHRAINFLTTPATYTPPSSFGNYNMTVSPVTCTSGCTTTGPVVLAGGVTGVTSNYPDATVRTAFAAAVQGTLATNIEGIINDLGKGTVTYGATARLISMRPVTSYGGGSGVVQVWELTAVGTVPGALPATVEVTAILERNLADAQTFAVFATGTGCGAIDLGGNVATGSYNSAISSTTSEVGGNLGTNGNLDIAGSVEVHGSLSSPRSGVGTCVDGSGVTALTESGNAEVDNNDIIQLPQALNFETPAAPSPMPPTTAQDTCAEFAVVLPATCNVISGTATIDPMGTTVVLGNISGDIKLLGGSYIINSMASGDLSIGTSLLGADAVTMNIAGKTSLGAWMTEPFNLTGNDIVNPSPTKDASKLQIMYAGTGKFDMHGGAQAAFVLYAPNAEFESHGNADMYGSILVKKLLAAGTANFYYDKKLDSTAYTLGNYVMTSFSWKKY